MRVRWIECILLFVNCSAWILFLEFWKEFSIWGVQRCVHCPYYNSCLKILIQGHEKSPGSSLLHIVFDSKIKALPPWSALLMSSNQWEFRGYLCHRITILGMIYIGHTFWHLKLKTLDFSKSQKQYPNPCTIHKQLHVIKQDAFLLERFLEGKIKFKFMQMLRKNTERSKCRKLFFNLCVLEVLARAVSFVHLISWQNSRVRKQNHA